MIGPAVVAAAALLPADLRYDLRVGDRIVYRQVLEQATQAGATEQATRTEWRNQVLVVAEGTDGLVVGFQRQRRMLATQWWFVMMRPSAETSFPEHT